MNVDPAPESQLPWTGERYLPQIAGEIQLEHVHRYLVAREYAKDKDVLDIACGEGFGSAILAESARYVVGVDIAAEAVVHASIRYRRENIRFREGSCAAIPLGDASVDLVVSFETIEHHDEHKAMMGEIKRVLRPSGLLIISSPDKKEYSILTNYRNPFHVRELFKEEFEDLIRGYFKNLVLLSQRIVYGSGILSNTPALRTLDYDIQNIDRPNPGLARCRYHIALASDGALPLLSGGLLEAKLEEAQIVTQLTEQVAQLTEQVAQLNEQARAESSQSADKIRGLEEQVHSGSAQAAKQIQKLEEQLGTSAERVRQVEEQFVQLNLTLLDERRLSQSIRSSLSWKMTWPLRVVWDATAAIRSQLRGFGGSSNSAPVGETVSDQRANFLADLIDASRFFNAATYEGAAEARDQRVTPALHYVLLGEKRGLKPSSAFDPGYYGKRYPDIMASGENRLGHYLEKGQAEGRRALPIAATLTFPVAGIKRALPTVLLLVHEASRTGAPILGWNIARALCHQNNVVTILMKGGPLEEMFEEVSAEVVRPFGNEIFDWVEGSKFAHRLAEIYGPSYVIANSTATRALVPGFKEAAIPVVALVHEFASRMGAGSLSLLFETAAEIVFPADLVRRASEIDYPFLRLRNTHVLPQGPSTVPRPRDSARDRERAEGEREIRSRLRPQGTEEDLIVVGMGFIEWRKGIDFFIAAATAILARDPKAAVRFVWVGEGYQGPLAIEVSSYLAEQILRSDLGEHFDLMDAVEEVESIYKEADVLFLSSRLDPLPNVSIDAALRGIPVVCFAEASGMAEILASSEGTRELVVPHLDAGAAAALIGSLAVDADRLKRLGNAISEVARKHFNMAAYVSALDELGRQAKASLKQEEADAALILSTGAFDSSLYLGDGAAFVEIEAAVREYSSRARMYNYARASLVHQACTRRPLAGFHPVTYALQNPNYDAQAGGDPLAHYLRAGRPEGSWAHRVLRIESTEEAARTLPRPGSWAPRLILHGHFHYPDLVGDFMRAVAANEQTCELILTTNSAEKAAQIRATLKKNGAAADIRVVPNRGRDIGPFLTLLEEVMGRCDLIGHVHGKRSVHVDVQVGERWRVFLWQHLIGDKMPMIDIIKEAFAEDPLLGLVFPEDPFLVGWDKNFELAQELAVRMEFREPLPPTLECPVGTMFWARPEALAPLLRLKLAGDEYPAEPVPIDGTILHALERLFSLVAKEEGYHYSTTYLPQFVR